LSLHATGKCHGRKQHKNRNEKLCDIGNINYTLPAHELIVTRKIIHHEDKKFTKIKRDKSFWKRV